MLTLHGSTCLDCANERERQRSRNRGMRHYTGDYRKRAKAVRDAAIACHWCGEGFTPDNPVQADHVIAGDPYSPLVAACRRCNAGRGNKKDWKPRGK